jgi:hypothetical protein
MKEFMTIRYPIQERLIEILKWNPGHFARTTGENLLAIANSKKPWWRKKLMDTTTDYYFKMLELTSDDMEIIAVIRFWLHDAKIPLEVNSELLDHLQMRIGNMLLEVNNRNDYLEFDKRLKNIIKE